MLPMEISRHEAAPVALGVLAAALLKANIVAAGYGK